MTRAPIDMLLDGAQWKPTGITESGEDGLPYATHEAVIDLCGVTMRCYQLNDGRRIFHADDVAKFFKE